MSGRQRPQLVVMEEAHRYLGRESDNLARTMVQRIVKAYERYNETVGAGRQLALKLAESGAENGNGNGEAAPGETAPQA